MENCRKHSRVRQWGPVPVLILIMLTFWFKPSHAYYICPQSDGSQLITDSPGPGCVSEEQADTPGLSSGGKPQQSLENPKRESSGASSNEQLDFHGNNREWWQSRVGDLKKEKNDLQLQILDAQRRLDKLTIDLLGVKNSSQKRRIRKEIDTLNEMLRIVDQTLSVELPEEARKAGVPPGWLR